MVIPQTIRDRAAEIHQVHRSTRDGLLRRRCCRYCRQPYPCQQVRWADDVDADEWPGREVWQRMLEQRREGR